MQNLTRKGKKKTKCGIVVLFLLKEKNKTNAVAECK